MNDLEGLMIYKQYLELIYYTENITVKYPKNEKLSLVSNIKNNTYEGMKKIILTQKYMRIMKRKYNEYYILKLDIKKYFYNIDKNILYDIMSEYISDKLLLDLTKKIIYDNDDSVGIPIGNYTSQYFANIYLDKLDKYIKDKLKIKYYIRYMDDFVLLLETKEECKILKEKISIFLKDKLHLQLNEKSRYYLNKMGINFCGYRIYETHMLIRDSSKKKIKKKIRKWNKDYDNNKLNITKLILSFNSWLGHSSHANSYNISNKYKSKIKYFKDKCNY